VIVFDYLLINYTALSRGLQTFRERAFFFFCLDAKEAKDQGLETRLKLKIIS